MFDVMGSIISWLGSVNNRNRNRPTYLDLELNGMCLPTMEKKGWTTSFLVTFVACLLKT